MLNSKSFFESWSQKDKTDKLYMTGGALALVLALVGVVFPVIPQIPFAIISAYLFSKSSPKFHKWIRQSKVFGKSVRDWEDRRVIRPTLKATSIIFMFAGAGLAHWRLPLGWAIAIDTAFVCAIVFILLQKSHEE